MMIEVKDEGEQLVAQQAVLAFRAVRAAMEAAPCGQGLAVTEEAVLDHGGETLRVMLQEALDRHEQVQKKGPVAGRVGAGRRRGSSVAKAKT